MIIIKTSSYLSSKLIISCHMDMTRHEQKDDVKIVINFFTYLKSANYALTAQEKNLNHKDFAAFLKKGNLT